MEHDGEVVEVVPGVRAVFVVLDNSSSRLHKREDLRTDTTKRYHELDERRDNELEETMRTPRKVRQVPNTDQAVR